MYNIFKRIEAIAADIVSGSDHEKKLLATLFDCELLLSTWLQTQGERDRLPQAAGHCLLLLLLTISY
jgi:hypothetical protein